MLILQSLLSILATILFQFSDEWKLSKLSKLSKKVLVGQRHTRYDICYINTRIEHHRHHRREMGAQLNWKWKRAAGAGSVGAKYPS
jgi:hypothetical protein